MFFFLPVTKPDIYWRSTCYVCGRITWRWIWISSSGLFGFSRGAGDKELACQCRRHKSCGFDPWVGKIPWRRAWQPTSVFLPGECPWLEEPGRLQSMGSQRDGHDWVTKPNQYHSGLFQLVCSNWLPWLYLLQLAFPLLLLWRLLGSLDKITHFPLSVGCPGRSYIS